MVGSMLCGRRQNVVGRNTYDARGRNRPLERFARLLPVVVQCRHRHEITLMPEGICNKCGERKELILAGCVCRSCSDRLDKQWADSTVIDWVLVAPPSGPGIEDIREQLKESLAKEKKRHGDSEEDSPTRIAERPPGRYIYRNTTYSQMKSHAA